MLGGHQPKRRLQDHYCITGFISSGTYGRVFKAEGINGTSGVFAIKKYTTLPHLAQNIINMVA